MGQKNPPPKKNGDTNFPGLKPKGPESHAKTQYEELQQNEVMVLQAIYGDDFTEHKATHSAWKVGLQAKRRVPQLEILTFEKKKEI